MARQPQVTRTIKTTKVTVMCLDIILGEPCNQVVTLPRTYKDEKKLFKLVQEKIDNETIKAVHIVDKAEKETLYGMTEDDFIKYATILPPRTTKETANEGEN